MPGTLTAHQSVTISSPERHHLVTRASPERRHQVATRTSPERHLVRFSCGLGAACQFWCGPGAELVAFCCGRCRGLVCHRVWCMAALRRRSCRASSSPPLRSFLCCATLSDLIIVPAQFADRPAYVSAEAKRTARAARTFLPRRNVGPCTILQDSTIIRSLRVWVAGVRLRSA